MNYHDRTFGDYFWRQVMNSYSADVDDWELYIALNDMMSRDMDADIED